MPIKNTKRNVPNVTCAKVLQGLKKVDCIDINGYKILICTSSLPLLQPCQPPRKKWP